MLEIPTLLAQLRMTLRHCEVASDQQTSQWLFAAKQPAVAGTDGRAVAIS